MYYIANAPLFRRIHYSDAFKSSVTLPIKSIYAFTMILAQALMLQFFPHIAD